MRSGTIVRLPDGREGTVVYHGEELNAIYAAHGDLVRAAIDMAVFERIRPQAMLRKPELEPPIGLPCVGEDYEVVLGDAEAQA